MDRAAGENCGGLFRSSGFQGTCVDFLRIYGVLDARFIPICVNFVLICVSFGFEIRSSNGGCEVWVGNAEQHRW